MWAKCTYQSARYDSQTLEDRHPQRDDNETEMFTGYNYAVRTALLGGMLTHLT
jgi:hypothetical protein